MIVSHGLLAPLAEAVPVLVAPEIVFVAGWLALIALLYTYRYTLGAFLRELANVLKIDVWRFHLDLSGAVDKIDYLIQTSIGRGIAGMELASAKGWDAIKWSAQATVEQYVDAARALHWAVEGLVGAVIPGAIDVGTAPVKTSIRGIRAQLRAEATRLLRALAARAEALERTFERDFGRAWRGIDNIQSVRIPKVAAVVAGIAAGLEALRRYAHRGLAGRLGRLERILGAGVIGGIALGVLTRVFPWWQCRNVRRLMRGVCRSPFGSLDWLFTLTFEAFLVTDLCDFITALAYAAKKVEPILLAFVSAEDVLIGCNGIDKPRAWSGAAAALPPRQPVAALPTTGV